MEKKLFRASELASQLPPPKPTPPGRTVLSACFQKGAAQIKTVLALAKENHK